MNRVTAAHEQRRLAARHEYELLDTPGGGTTVVLTLPMRERPAAAS